MNAGDVELSGAVDFSPNELDKKPKTQEVKNAETTVETANKPASVKEEDVRFYSDKIKTNNNDMFVRVEGGERRKRAAKRREEREQKEALREAKMANKRSGAASGLVGESEKELKKEQRRLAKEQRKQKRSERWGKIFGWFKKHWYIFVGLVVIAAVAVGVLLAINIISDMQAKQAAAEKEQFVKENKTDVQRVFAEVAGKELTKEKIDAIVKKYNGRIVVEYYAQAVSIRPASDYSELISSPLATGENIYREFSLESHIGGDKVFIYKREKGYEYYHNDSQMFEDLDEALGAYLTEKKEEQNND